MNELERHIFDGALQAQKQHRDMTDGCWLSRGPESFLQTVISLQLATTGHFIYIDRSIKGILKELGRGPGRPARYERQRPDISVWYKNGIKLRAVIEIKRAWNFDTVKRDAKKIERYLAPTYAARTGYILAYSEATRKHAQLLKRRFGSWEQRLGAKWTKVAIHVDDSYNDPNWVWGIVLLRYDRPRNRRRVE